MLDDYHELNQQNTQDILLYFVDHQPANLSILITSRTEPAWPLARLRARQQLLEIRTEQLRFDKEEAVQFLALHNMDKLTYDDTVKLNEKTEGWIAGLQLALLSLQNASQKKQVLQALQGQDRFVMDYLTDEVLSHPDSNSRQFLLPTSVLEQMNASLAAAVSEIDNTDEMLSSLEKRNMFLFALDNKGEWYRYHHLFAELLQHQLARSGANTLKNAHSRASDWYAKNNLIQAAIDHAFKADDVERIGVLLDMHGESLRNL